MTFSSIEDNKEATTSKQIVDKMLNAMTEALAEGVETRQPNFEFYVKLYEAQQVTQEDKKVFYELLNRMRAEGINDDKHWIYKGEYVCRIHRNPFGNLCGYVGVPPGHPCHGMHYDEVHEKYESIRVHGGLTYSDTRHEWGKDNIWFLGFDTGHAWDLGLHPRMSTWGRFDDVTYKDMDYVTKECNNLAVQLEEIAKHNKNKNNNAK